MSTWGINSGGGAWGSADPVAMPYVKDTYGSENANGGWNATGTMGTTDDIENGDSGASDERGCFRCGEIGHMKSECPTAPEGGDDRGCFNCGESGHNKSECTNARKFTGTCNVCGEEGHMRKECPKAEPQLCKNCGQEGHTRSHCENARIVDRSGVGQVDAEQAWSNLSKAIKERDMDEVKECIQKYLKCFPDITMRVLQQALYDQELGLHLIATERQLLPTYTNMDYQGNLKKKYSVSYRFSDKPARPREAEGWPMDRAEILERLDDAGDVAEIGLPKCTNCNEIGHIRKSCPEEKREVTDRPVVSCYNCGETGHRVRDCPTPRVDKNACRNCGQGGHLSNECTEPRSAANVECRKCNEMGHFSKDCPQGGGGGACHNCGEEGHKSRDCTEPRKPKCRNCDEMGHIGKDCPKPRDMSRVQCMNCNEYGHFKTKCQNPPSGDPGDDGDFPSSGGNSFGGTNNDGFGDKENSAPDSGAGGAWMTGGQGAVGNGGDGWPAGAQANTGGGDAWNTTTGTAAASGGLW